MRPIESRTSFARVAYWHYDPLIHMAPFSNVSDDKPTIKLGVMSTEIESVRIDKDINNVSGTFEITVLPSKNWKKEISPGDWLVIYLFSGKEGSIPNTVMNKNVALFGNVDRVARSKQRDENSDKTLVRYVISGRDFGKVFEDTDIFFDPRCIQTQNAAVNNVWLTANGVPFNGSPKELMQKLLGVFVGGTPINDAISKGVKSTPFGSIPLRQWMIPGPIVSFFAGASLPKPSLPGDDSKLGLITDIMSLQLSEVAGNAGRTVVSTGESLWEVLLRASNRSVNEIFVDLDRNSDGTAYPMFVLRPRPQSPLFQTAGLIEPVAFNALGDSWFTLKKLAESDRNVVTLTDNDVRFENIGKNHQAMFNMLWMKSQMLDSTVATWPSANTQTGFASIGNPMYSRQSINRYGLKILDEMQDFVYNTGGLEINHAVNILKGFLLQRYDQTAYNHLYDNGTLETTGMIDAAVGKVLRVHPPKESTFLDFPKLFYVEGYTHEYKYPGMWMTTWKVTNGVSDNSVLPFIDLDSPLSSDDWGAQVAQTMETHGSDSEFKPQMGLDMGAVFDSPLSMAGDNFLPLGFK